MTKTNKRTEDLSVASPMTRQSLESEAEKLLGMMNAKVVMQVCGNFALKEKFGELTKELNDSRAKEHHKIIEGTLAALLKTVDRYVEERELLARVDELAKFGYASFKFVLLEDGVRYDCIDPYITARIATLRQQVKGGEG